MTVDIARHLVAVGVSVGVLFGPTQLHAEASKYDQAVGHVAAAYGIYTTCKGVGPSGPDDYQGFVFAATDILATQGFRRQKMRALLFYGKTTSIDGLKSDVLAARGVDSSDPNAVCAFGRSIAGKNDTIGQFLVRK